MRLSLSTVALFLMLTIPAVSQENCTVPLPPVLTLVSVQPETGNIDISWNPSPSTNIAAYIVYTYNETTAGWISVDTIKDPSITNYTYLTSATKYQIVKFVVAAYRLPLAPGKDGCPSELSNSLSTIFCSTAFDTCRAKIAVMWNKYQDAPKKVTGYTIFVSENSGPLIPKYDTPAIADSYSINTFSTDANYCYAIRASLDDATFSFSNKTCIVTSFQNPPSWISTDYVRVNENKDIELAWSADPSSEITRYVLEKAGTSFSTVASLSASGSMVFYTDRNADLTKINYYRLKAINNCDLAALTSEVSSNILPVIRNSGNQLEIDWNQVVTGTHSHEYELMINTGSGYRFLASTDTSTAYSAGLADIVFDLTAGQLCFQVRAGQKNPVGSAGESISSEACFSPGETVTVPNLFTPNNDLLNDLFRPVMSFTPSAYHLVISDRDGKVLFESGDFNESWDGSDAVQGVYLWTLRVTAPSGKKISKTGTVAIKK
ncbi:MAG TPA: gliding motility-associated C-terminal domain-containing protein [Bacteroidales bacterium]|nr:gliding motility-associated C-terminal domain-containing protein [Bacteroidales bacterium]